MPRASSRRAWHPRTLLSSQPLSFSHAPPPFHQHNDSSLFDSYSALLPLLPPHLLPPPPPLPRADSPSCPPARGPRSCRQRRLSVLTRTVRVSLFFFFRVPCCRLARALTRQSASQGIFNPRSRRRHSPGGSAVELVTLSGSCTTLDWDFPIILPDLAALRPSLSPAKCATVP